MLQWIMYGALAVNAFFVARKAILFVQNGSDKVADPANKTTKYEVWCWQDGSGILVVTVAFLASPALTAFKVAKFLMFPRGIKSNYAKEKERREAQERIDQADRELLKQMPELERQVRSWAPGGYILDVDQLQADLDRIENDTIRVLDAKVAEHRPWVQAADSFDEYAALIEANAGMPWVQPPTKPAKVRKAKP